MTVSVSGVRDRLLEVRRPVRHAVLRRERARPLLRARVHHLDAVAIPLPVQRPRVEEPDEARPEHRHPVAGHVRRSSVDSILARAVASAAVRNVQTGDGRRRLYFTSRGARAAVSRRCETPARPARRAGRGDRPRRVDLRRRHRRGRARPRLRHRPLADPGRGAVPALRLVPGLPPDRRALDDQPHAGGGRERPAPGDVHRAGRGSGRGDPRQLRAGAAGRHDRLQPRRR